MPGYRPPRRPPPWDRSQPHEDEERRNIRSGRNSGLFQDDDNPPTRPDCGGNTPDDSPVRGEDNRPSNTATPAQSGTWIPGSFEILAGDGARWWGPARNRGTRGPRPRSPKRKYRPPGGRHKDAAGCFHSARGDDLLSETVSSPHRRGGREPLEPDAVPTPSCTPSCGTCVPLIGRSRPDFHQVLASGDQQHQSGKFGSSEVAARTVEPDVSELQDPRGHWDRDIGSIVRNARVSKVSGSSDTRPHWNGQQPGCGPPGTGWGNGPAHWWSPPIGTVSSVAIDRVMGDEIHYTPQFVLFVSDTIGAERGRIRRKAMAAEVRIRSNVRAASTD